MKRMINNILIILIPFTLILTVLIPAAAFAADRPTSQEVRKVMDYYNGGIGQGAVLVDYTLCSEMGKDDENKNECTLSFSGNVIKAGDEVYLWMNFMVPAGDTAAITLAYTRNGRIRHTQNFTLTAAFRYRTWKKLFTDKPGEWTVQIYQDLGNSDIDLGSFAYTVKE